MAALGRGPPAMKGGGKHVHVGSSRLVSLVLGCFLVFLVLVVSSRYNAAVVLDARRPGDFRPRRGQGDDESHGELRRIAQRSNDDDDKAVVSELRDAEPEEQEGASTAAAAAATSNNSDEQAGPAADDADQAKSSLIAPTAAQVAVQRTSPPHELPVDTVTTTPAGADPVGGQPLCDLSGFRADVCDFAGDIRMDANASEFVVVGDPAGGPASAPTTTYKVRPYARKGDATSMGRVTEITVRAAGEAAPRCTATHAEPAVVFSISGYTGNLFHDFTDVLVPLYGTAQRFRGDVRLVVADASPWTARWLVKYGAILRGLSRHAPLDLAKAAAAREVHCFRRAVVGLRAHRELMLDDGDHGVGTGDFTRFLRRALSLPRDAPARLGGVAAGTGRPRPRLLVVARRGTRLLLNVDAVVRVAGEVGFEAVVSELDVGNGDDVAPVGRLVNSFDAFVGVHGAGLTNMVFLPPGATVVQIVPWGGLQWIARMDFGDPAEAMGLRYIQYEVAVHESTLRDKYPRDHEIFTNPTALHKKGFKFLRDTFLKGQDIIVDVERFRAVLLQAMKNLEH